MTPQERLDKASEQLIAARKIEGDARKEYDQVYLEFIAEELSKHIGKFYQLRWDGYATDDEFGYRGYVRIDKADAEVGLRGLFIDVSIESSHITFDYFYCITKDDLDRAIEISADDFNKHLKIIKEKAISI